MQDQEGETESRTRYREIVLGAIREFVRVHRNKFTTGDIKKMRSALNLEDDEEIRSQANERSKYHHTLRYIELLEKEGKISVIGKEVSSRGNIKRTVYKLNEMFRKRKRAENDKGSRKIHGKPREGNGQGVAGKPAH